MSVVIIVLIFIASLLSAFYNFSTRHFGYWKKRNVPFLKPTPLFGNYGNYIRMKKIMGMDSQTVCKAFPKEPYVGAYFGTEPALIVQDPELIKLILIKDFYNFNGREISDYSNCETNTRNLFFASGDRWKVIRHNLSPLFTSSKIKKMFPLIQKCAYTFEDLLDFEAGKSKVLDMRAMVARYTMDCIGACGFGVDTNVMGSNCEKNVFKMIGDSIFKLTNSRGLALVSRLIWPSIFYGLGFRVFPKMVTDFFHNLVTGVFKERNYEPSSRHDFVDMLLTLKKDEYITCSSIKDKNLTVTLKVDDELLSANCVAFFAAGYETSAITSSYVLYELAKNQEAQLRAIAEVDEYLKRNNNKLVYECISEMPFIDACIDEVMRLYPALNVLTREVMEDYTLPTGLRLEKNLRIHIPVYHLHHNPEYFPEPEKFRPERFLPEEKRNITPYTYLPFGEGPRICSGMKLAKVLMFPGIIAVLKKYKVELTDGVPLIPNLDARAFVTRSSEGLMLRLVEREGWESRKYNQSI